MKRAYILLHVVAIPLYLLITYLAFVVLIPAYLIVVILGFELWRNFVEGPEKQHKLLRAMLVGIAQTVGFIVLILIEVKIIGLPFAAKQLVLIMGFAAYFSVGFLLISLGTLLFSQRELHVQKLD